MNFKIINRIAKTELQTLFYTPVAWLLLVVFSVHIGCDFLAILREIIKIKALGRTITFSVTAGVVLGSQGIYEVIQDSIYLYIPLLTMNLMSREFNSGSIKLLYSSPVSSTEIILGKFASMLVCTAIFTFILALPAMGVMFMVPHADITLMLAALLSMFLLMMTYCSIGLFMSTLTSYQVVAAVATLSVLAFFNFVGTIGQNSPFIREITYWLSIKGRASEMVGGLICSDDVIYFIAVTAFFLALSIIHLSSKRTMKYAAAFAVLTAVAFISSRPAMKTFYDATRSDDRTLSKESREVLEQLDGGMTITTYVDVLDSEFENFTPSRQLLDRDRFKMYTRFKPEIKMKYVYYYSPIADTSILNRYPGLSEEETAMALAKSKGFKNGKLVRAEDLLETIDLREENYQFVRVIRRESGEEARLRLYDDLLHHPEEGEISAAMKKMIVDPIKVATLTGHNERSIIKSKDRDYSIFATNGKLRQSMINQGFNLEEVNIKDMPISPDINILLVADPTEPLSEDELDRIDDFIARGGNLLIATDVDRYDSINPLLSLLGLSLGDTVNAEETIPARVSDKAPEFMGGFYRNMARNPENAAVFMPGASSLNVVDTSRFKAVPLLVSDSTDVTLALALTRKRENDMQQRIIVTADADCFSNSFLQLAGRQNGTSYNFSMLPASFRWLCYGVFPVSSSRTPKKDLAIRLEPMQMSTVNVIYCIIIPLVIAAIGLLILSGRKKR